MIREGPLNIFIVKKRLDNPCFRNSDENVKSPIDLLSVSFLLASVTGVCIQGLIEFSL